MTQEHIFWFWSNLVKMSAELFQICKFSWINYCHQISSTWVSQCPTKLVAAVYIYIFDVFWSSLAPMIILIIFKRFGVTIWFFPFSSFSLVPKSKAWENRNIIEADKWNWGCFSIPIVLKCYLWNLNSAMSVVQQTHQRTHQENSEKLSQQVVLHLLQEWTRPGFWLLPPFQNWQKSCRAHICAEQVPAQDHDLF